MQIIDSHAHLYPAELNRAPAAWAAAHGESHWALLCARTRKDGRAVQGFPNLDDLLRTMDAEGVSRAILQGWYWEKPQTCIWQNRFYAECIRAHPDRLGACAALHPAMGIGGVRDEIKRAADAGFVGLGELSPHSQRVAPDDAALHEALHLAGELGLAVNFHVTETSGGAGRRAYPGKVETPPGDFARWAQAHPKTRFVLSHWGARLPFDAEWGATARALTNLFYDTAASPLIYGAADSARLWREMIDTAGADRILFGTDYPLILYPNKEYNPSIASLVAEARGAGLTDTEFTAVLGANAQSVFVKSGGCGMGSA